MTKQQKGGAVTALLSRKRALEKYYLNPNKCKCCKQIIEVREGEKVSVTRVKKFCTQSCAAHFNNQKFPKRIKQEKVVKEQAIKKRVIKKPFTYFIGRTKGQHRQIKGIYYRFRADIRKHAHYVFNLHHDKKECSVCNYDKHIEVAHIKSVSEFNDDALITEINDIKNLIGLCPNCHWEFDTGLIKILYENVVQC
jgi:predicted restriction endonuclease